MEAAPEYIPRRQEMVAVEIEHELEFVPGMYFVVVGINPYNHESFVDDWTVDQLPLARAIDGIGFVGLYKQDDDDPEWVYLMDLGWVSKAAHDASRATPARDAALAHIKTLGEIEVIHRVEEIVSFTA